MIILGCNGFTDENGFVYCNSVVNPIINLSKVGGKERERIITFLEKACGLFEAPCFDYNKSINIINLLYRQFGIIDEEKLHKIQAFIRMHKSCGIYLMLMLEEDYYEQSQYTVKQ
tara:strand:+ start:535 stop:879 length:345 start_codon:yes stop_codon:yes gene_type:complete